MNVQVDTETRLGAEDPGQVRDVCEPEFLSGQERPFSEAIVYAIVILVLLARPQGVLAGRGIGIERV